MSARQLSPQQRHGAPASAFSILCFVSLLACTQATSPRQPDNAISDMPQRLNRAAIRTLLETSHDRIESDNRAGSKRSPDPTLLSFLGLVAVHERVVTRDGQSRRLYTLHFLIDVSLFPQDLKPKERDDLLNILGSEANRLLHTKGIETRSYDWPSDINGPTTTHESSEAHAGPIRAFEKEWNATHSYRPDTRPVGGPAALASRMDALVNLKQCREATSLFHRHTPPRPDPAYSDAIGMAFYAYLSCGQAKAALTEMEPYLSESWIAAIDNAAVVGNMASAYALGGEPDTAMAFIRRALAMEQASFTLKYVRRETDFDSLRARPDFKALLAKRAETNALAISPTGSARGTVMTDAGSLAIWDRPTFLWVMDYPSSEQELGDDDDKARHIKAGAYVPVDIGADGVYDCEIRTGTAQRPAVLSAQERGRVLQTSAAYLFVSTGELMISGIEYIDGDPDEQVGRMPLAPGRYAVTVHWLNSRRVRWLRGEEAPDSEELPDFVIFVAPIQDGQAFRQEVRTFEWGVAHLFEGGAKKGAKTIPAK